MKKIAISIGDLNGVGVELALKNHHIVKKICDPIYCIDKPLLEQSAKLLDIPIPDDFKTYGKYKYFKIKPSKVSKNSGKFSYESFLNAIKLAKKKKVNSIVTLPINKSAWAKAGIDYVGHTDMLRDIFKKDAIMMLGCKKMYVALYTEHIPLKDVAKSLKIKRLTNFLKDFYTSIGKPNKKIALLALNPHAGDDGVLGDEEKKIYKAMDIVHNYFQKDIFELQVPDIAFTPHVRKQYDYFVALYHDQGLAPLKALYFDESINVSLNLPIKRASVDHGTAFDIAYKNSDKLSNKSYINSIKFYS